MISPKTVNQFHYPKQNSFCTINFRTKCVTAGVMKKTTKTLIGKITIDGFFGCCKINLTKNKFFEEKELKGGHTAKHFSHDYRPTELVLRHRTLAQISLKLTVTSLTQDYRLFVTSPRAYT